MIMTDTRKEKVVKDILYTRETEPAKVRRITLSGMASYFKAVKTFGPGSPVAKEALKTIKEMLKISKIENKLLLFILHNIDEFDISATEDAVLRLERLNDSTYDSYYGVLSEINAACANKDKNRQLRPEKGIDSLLTNNRYKTMVLGLTNTFEDIKEYLPYEEEFWIFIKPNLKVLPTTGEGARIQCGIQTIRNGEDNTLVNFITVVPKVVDYETAMEAIRVYKKAHDLYLCLGKDMSLIEVTNANQEQMQYRESIEKEANRRFR